MEDVGTWTAHAVQPARCGARRAVLLLPLFMALVLDAGTSLRPDAWARPRADRTGPDATTVVVRGTLRLADALAGALHAAAATRDERDTKPFACALIIDPTPRLGTWMPYLARALKQVEIPDGLIDSWRVAPLGGRFGKAQDSAAALADTLAQPLDTTAAIPNTTSALRASLKTLRMRRPLVIYLADEHAEDDWELEALVGDVQKSKAVFCAIGPEAAFGRGWNDGIVGVLEVPAGATGLARTYWPGVGRDPFGRGAASAPWHGGDTASPLVAYDFPAFEWATEFDGEDLAQLGDDPDARRRSLDAMLAEVGEGETFSEEKFEAWRREILRETKVELAALPADDDGPAGDVAGLDLERSAPLPSSYGPYGLMRVAGMSGGRYFTFAWNRIQAPAAVYDYGRCNLFPPDLRPRDEILAYIRRDALARACMQSWVQLGAWGSSMTRTRPPLAGRALKEIQSIDTLDPYYELGETWSDTRECATWVSTATEAMAAIQSARTEIARHRPDDPGSIEPQARRYVLEADRALHILHAHWLRLAVGVAAARNVPRSAWATKDTLVSLHDKTWISRARDAENLRVAPDLVPAALEEEAAAFLAEHKRLLEHYRGTPLGAEVAMNWVYLPRVRGFEAPADTSRPRPLPRTPPTRGGSEDAPPAGAPPAGGAGSTGGGATTGGG